MLTQNIIANMEEIIEGCMGEASPGCVATCPMHTNVKEYVKLIREGKGKEAISVIRENLFIPGTLGRICAHPCEGKCKWSEQSNPIAIAGLKRYAADNFDDELDWDMSKEVQNGNKVAIIGSGPAGAQTALELIRAGYEVTIFEKLPYVGGMMRVGIPEYRLPRHIIDKEYSYLSKLGVVFKLGVEIGKDITLDQVKAEYDAVVIAIGKHKGRIDTSITNYDAKGIYSAADFLREVALTQKVEGVGKRILVVGGGDVAMDCIRVGLRLKGVESVQGICLEASEEEMFASTHEKYGAKQEGATFNCGAALKKIKVDETGRVSGIDTKKCIRLFNEQGVFSPVFDEKQTQAIEVDTIVFAIGQVADATFAKDSLTIRDNTTFECDELTLQSPDDKKIFFAGDVSGQSAIVVQAMATGRRAAQSVIRYLEDRSLTEGRNLEETTSYETKLKRDLDWSTVPKVERRSQKELDVVERVKSFDEVELGFTENEAKEEASRCLQCQCRLCMKECIMLPEFTQSPKVLFENYLEKGIYEEDKMIAYSCNECSQCARVCPKDYDLKEIFMALKKDYAEMNGGLAPIWQHISSHEAQEKECSKEYCSNVYLVGKKEEQ